MKQLIILVCTIPLEHVAMAKARTRLAELRALLNKTFDEKLQEETNTIIKTFVLAGLSNQESKLECIYPLEPTPEIMTKLDEINIKQNDWKL